MRSDRLRRFLRVLSSALLRLLLGLALGYIGLALIAYFHPGEGQEAGVVPALVKAFEGGLWPILRGGEGGFLLNAAHAAPVALIAVGFAFAARAGLYQLGGAGQYAIGVSACAMCFAFLSLPWYVCVLASVLAGALLGVLAGWLKNRFTVHEGLATAILSWVGVYGAAALMKSFAPVPAAFSDLSLPAAILPAAVALLLWLVMSFTSAGWAHATRGVGEGIARYAGMDTKKITLLTLTASAALAGLAGGLSYCLGLEAEAPGIRLALTGAGLQGLAAGVLAGGNPLGAVFFSGLIAHAVNGASGLDGAVFPPETGEWIIAQLLFLCAAGMLSGRKNGKGGNGL